MTAIANLVQQKTAGAGTGDLALSAVPGRRGFADAFGTGGVDVFFYFISHAAAAEWEVGTGHMSDAATLVRDTVVDSSNGGALVDFSAGTKQVVNDLPASVQAQLETLASDLAEKADAEDVPTLTEASDIADGRIAAQRGAVNGIAALDGSGRVPTAQMPPLAITNTFAVSSEAAQLALSADEGDVAVRTDENKSYIHNGGSAGTMADWQELLTPTDSVLSVNGQTGTVTLGMDDIENMPIVLPTNDSTPGGSIGVGLSALSSQTGGNAYYNSIAIGRNALGNSTMTTGAVDNAAIGADALRNVTSGAVNVAFGRYSLSSNTGGSFNTAVGSYALGDGNSPNYNTAVGVSALLKSAAYFNTGIGVEAGAAVTSGQNNTLIGYRVGQANLTTGSFNIAIGVNSSVFSSNVSHTAIIKGTGTAVLSATGTNGTPEVTLPTLNITDNHINLATKTPASASASGTAGDVAWDSSYIYVCVAANTWKRAALGSW